MAKKKYKLVPFKCVVCGHIQEYTNYLPDFIFGHCYQCKDCVGFKIQPMEE
jgi:hypothetical protein